MAVTVMWCVQETAILTWPQNFSQKINNIQFYNIRNFQTKGGIFPLQTAEQKVAVVH